MNDTEKMTAIYLKYKTVMFAVAMKVLNNPHDAEDAVHNAILPIMRNLNAIKDIDSRDCVYYISMAVKNTALNMIRNRHIQTIDISEIEYELQSNENIADAFATDEECRCIYKAIAEMPSEYRDVLILHLYYEMSTSQISDLLGRKHGTVKSQLTRGKKILRTRLKEAGYEG